MRLALTAFVLGAAAIAALAAGLAVTAALVADASGRAAFALAPAGFELVHFARTPAGSSTTFGSGLVAFPLLGGLANAAAALLLARRRGRAP